MAEMARMVNGEPFVSVVVPTCRRPDLLGRCLGALLAQDLPGDSFEIIVSDDAACANTRRQLTAWMERARGKSISLRYVPVAGARGPAAARNAGWRAAHGGIIAFTGDDCIPAPDWLSKGLAAFGPETRPASERRVDGVCGRLVVPLPDAPTDYQRNAARLQHATFVTANCFYRRDMLAAIGGFDERFRMAWREDSDLHFRLMRRGARLIKVSDAVVTHPIRPALWGVSVGQQRKSMYNALLYKKHPARYRTYIQSAPPWRYYATVGALGGVALGLLARRRWLAGLAAALWLGLTMEFCARRLRGVSHAPAHIAEMVVTSLVIPPLAVFWRLRGAVRFRVWFL
jgi:GT2 family glycosyltransferase